MIIVMDVIRCLCFAAAAFFLGCLTFSVSLGSVNLLAAGLFCAALGWFIGAIPTFLLNRPRA